MTTPPDTWTAANLLYGRLKDTFSKNWHPILQEALDAARAQGAREALALASRSRRRSGATTAGATAMTHEKALKRISELSCTYANVRMTDCPYCAKEVQSLLRLLTEEEPPR